MVYNIAAVKTFKYQEIKKEILSNPEVKKAYDNLEPEFALIRQILQKRIEKNMSQEEFARKLGTNQSAVSRLESGTYNPSLKFLKKVAKALDTELKITFA